MAKRISSVEIKSIGFNVDLVLFVCSDIITTRNEDTEYQTSKLQKGRDVAHATAKALAWMENHFFFTR